MPPAVAQAPIVTRNFEFRRTSRIRSASAGGGDRAFDQRDVVGSMLDPAGGFEEMDNLQSIGDGQ